MLSLVAKMFELVWRLRQHRHCSAFDFFSCELDGHKCILTAAISYLYDARATDHRDLRHYRDGPICDLRPSALYCCLRMMEGMVLFDIKRNDAIGRSRFPRVADASRGLCASQALSGSVTILRGTPCDDKRCYRTLRASVLEPARPRFPNFMP